MQTARIRITKLQLKQPLTHNTQEHNPTAFIIPTQVDSPNLERRTRMQPDHLLSAIVGAFIGALAGIVFATIAAANTQKSGTYRTITAIIAFICSLLSGILGCVLGFEIIWNITNDVAAAGLGAVVGALLISVTGGLGITSEGIESRLTRKPHNES